MYSTKRNLSPSIFLALILSASSLADTPAGAFSGAQPRRNSGQAIGSPAGSQGIGNQGSGTDAVGGQTQGSGSAQPQQLSASEVAAKPLGEATQAQIGSANNAGQALSQDYFNPAAIQNYQNAVQGAQTGMRALEKKYENQMSDDQKMLLRYMMASQINPNAGAKQDSGSGSKSSSSSSSSPSKPSEAPKGLAPIGQISVPKVSDINVLGNTSAAPTVAAPRGEVQILQKADGQKVPVMVVDSLEPSRPSNVDTTKPPEAFGLQTFVSERAVKNSNSLTADESIKKSAAPTESSERGIASYSSSFVSAPLGPKADASSAKASSALTEKLKAQLAKLKNNKAAGKGEGGLATSDAGFAAAAPAGNNGLVVYSGKNGVVAEGDGSESPFGEFNGAARPGRYRTPNAKGDRMGPDVRQRGLLSLESVKDAWSADYDGNRWILIALAGLIALLAAGKKVTGNRRSKIELARVRIPTSKK